MGRSSNRGLGVPARLLGDESLAQQIAAGNERAFATLFHRYHQPLYRYCRSVTGNEPDAQDALQSALTKALVALREGRRNAPLRPWLFRIAHNESVTIIRSRSQAQELAFEPEAVQSIAHTVEERERFALLIEDLRELPERQRGALVMRELSGLSHEEISQALQISVGAAKQVILEARRSLMEFAEGRAMGCEQIQQMLSDADGRSLRGRKVRAHLRGCGSCSAFAAAIPRRRADMLALFPALPAAGAAGLLAQITGAGSGHGGGGAGLLAGTAAKGVGAAVSAKVAIVAGAAVVATATVGAVTVLHHSAPAHAVIAPPQQSLHREHQATASKPAVVPVHHVTAIHHRGQGGSQPGAASTHSRGRSAHGGTHLSGHGNSMTHSSAGTHGNSPSAPGHSSTAAGVITPGHSGAAHGKPVKPGSSTVKHAKTVVATHSVKKAKPHAKTSTSHAPTPRPHRTTSRHRTHSKLKTRSKSPAATKTESAGKGKSSNATSNSGRKSATTTTTTPTTTSPSGHGGHGNGSTASLAGTGAPN